MAEDIRMDSHKLIYHPEIVSRWLKGENIYPIEIEISPSGSCNHRCIFCAVDYIGYQSVFLKKDIILRDISQMSKKGLKSVICSGEGEPLLNKEMPDIVNGIKSCGVDVAMSTNGVLFSREKLLDCLAAFTWVRYSVASMEENSYNKIQRGKPGDLKKVKDNLAEAVRIKNGRKLKTTLGVQCLLMPDNVSKISDMARELREIGVDYLAIKPYSQHLHSKNVLQIDYDEMLELEQQLKEYETENFTVHFRAKTMKKMHRVKKYKQCLGLPFMTHIDAKGNVWPCVAHIGTEEFCYGNINEQTFEEIWEGQRRREVEKDLQRLEINKTCREACRLDEINKYLDELKHPGEHVNFI
ncbi:GTP 3',8-cyclase [Eubacterium plexicaudatum ASF492]|uniref:Radical SAM additional 4Fe4S-binding SPASM domain-containing protein n=1 Tax=Eubacterium plexicaudatum ASF492 TaxID=1235802 RepID=N2B6G4_9FIRM|nr:GTP 3',8-cyclase [Eubacterium plexicaudatum ASF492]